MSIASLSKLLCKSALPGDLRSTSAESAGTDVESISVPEVESPTRRESDNFEVLLASFAADVGVSKPEQRLSVAAESPDNDSPAEKSDECAEVVAITTAMLMANPSRPSPIAQLLARSVPAEQKNNDDAVDSPLNAVALREGYAPSGTASALRQLEDIAPDSSTRQATLPTPGSGELPSPDDIGPSGIRFDRSTIVEVLGSAARTAQAGARESGGRGVQSRGNPEPLSSGISAAQNDSGASSAPVARGPFAPEAFVSRNPDDPVAETDIAVPPPGRDLETTSRRLPGGLARSADVPVPRSREASLSSSGLVAAEPGSQARGPIADQAISETRGPIADQPISETRGPIADQPISETRGPIVDQPISETRGPIVDQPISETRGPIVDRFNAEDRPVDLNTSGVQFAGSHSIASIAVREHVGVPFTSEPRNDNEPVPVDPEHSMPLVARKNAGAQAGGGAPGASANPGSLDGEIGLLPPERSVATRTTATQRRAEPPKNAPDAKPGQLDPSPIRPAALRVVAPNAIDRPSRPTPDVPFADQVFRAVRRFRSQDGIHRVSLDLHPADLGSIALEVTIDGSTVHLSMTAEHAATNDLLRASLDELRSNLDEAGFTSGQLDVGLQHSDGRSSFRQDRQPQPQPYADPNTPSDANSSGGPGNRGHATRRPGGTRQSFTRVDVQL